MSRRRGGRGLTVVAVVLSLAFVIAAAGLLWLVATGGGPASAPDEPAAPELAPAAFEDYSWQDVAQVAQRVAAAGSDEEGAQIAGDYNLGVGSSRQLVLSNDVAVEVRVVGVRQDVRSDGSGVAGLTFMTSPIGMRPMEPPSTSEGGWQASGLRAWLADDGRALLPPELSPLVVPVDKLTNNVGVTDDVASVTTTSDALWLFSASEVCGSLTWFEDEYGAAPSAATGYVDFSAYDALLSAEGEQYAYFAQVGVTGSSDPAHALALGSAWWYRTPYPYSFTGDGARYFYQVMSSGFPSSTGEADADSGVVVGFCL